MSVICKDSKTRENEKKKEFKTACSDDSVG
jgi:hypothetical protein